MRILLTGATGFIGRHLTSYLQTYHDIFALVRSRPPLHPHSKICWIEQDLAKPLDNSRLPGNIDVLIHLAQSRLYREFPDQAGDIFDINIRSTFQLLEYARQVGVKYFIFASSGGVYGYNDKNFIETDPINPSNFYLSSKYSAELLITNYQQFYRTTIFRFFFVYGPGQQGMLIPTLLNKVQHGEKIVIEGRPGLRINPIYVADAIRVFESALNRPTSGIFNVCGDQVISITDLIRLIERVLGQRALIHYEETAPKGNLVGDNTLMKQILEVFPQTNLLEGISRMVL
jgi:UDP-glucose 4-epimerase